MRNVIFLILGLMMLSACVQRFSLRSGNEIEVLNACFSIDEKIDVKVREKLEAEYKYTVYSWNLDDHAFRIALVDSLSNNQAEYIDNYIKQNGKDYFFTLVFKT